MREGTIACFLGLLVLSCAPDGLSRDAVTNIEPGDATGSEFSGAYRVKIRTVECSGSCSADSGIFTVSFCDVGDLDEDIITFTQKDGVLEAEWEEPLSLLRGGINTDGTFDLGGFGTQAGGELEITLRSEGRFSSKGMSGTARTWFVGDIDEDQVDCVGAYDVTAEKLSGGGGGGGGDGGNGGNGGNGGAGGGNTGEPCDNDDTCTHGNVCNRLLNECRQPGLVGDPCFFDSDCEANECNSRLNECHPPGPPGFPCFFDNDCASNSCNGASNECN